MQIVVDDSGYGSKLNREKTYGLGEIGVRLRIS